MMLQTGKSIALAFLLTCLFSCFSVAFSVSAAFAATTIPFTINLSEAVNVAGTPRIPVDVGGVTRYATYTSGSGTSALTFTYTMVAGDVDLDGVTVSSPIDLNGGTIKDLSGNDLSPLTFTPPNTSNIKVNYPSLGMDFVYDADGRYTLNGTVYNDLTSFLSAAGGTFSRGGVGTYYDSTGILQTAASNVPRFDYDPTTHVAKGILIEESRTNLLTYSKDLSTNWTNFGSGTTTVTSTTEAAPDGTSTAIKLTVNRANTSQYTARKYNATLTLSGKNTSSIWIKAADATNVGKVITFWQFDGSVRNVTNYTLTSSWTRVTFNNAYSFSGGVSEPFNIGFLESSKGGSTDLTAVFTVWGAQIEQGAFVTSYIPTTSAAVTRGSDVMIVPTGTWYNQNAGSFYDNVEWASVSGSNYPMFFRVDDTTNNNRWNMFYNQSTSVIGIDAYASSTVQGAWSSSATSTSGTMKVAGAQALNNSNAAFNGTIKTLDTSWTPPTVTRLNISGGASTANTWHKTLKYYPLRVTDTQLQLLSQ